MTRQKAGSSLKGTAGPVGGVNAPAATACAAVIVVFASLISASRSQLCAATMLEPKASTASSKTEGMIQNGLRRDASRVPIFVLQESFEPALVRSTDRLDLASFFSLLTRSSLRSAASRRTAHRRASRLLLDQLSA